MIGYTVNSKVKRFIIAQRKKKKTWVTKPFLRALDNEINRVVTKSAEEVGDGGVISLAASLPKKKKITDRLVCDQRIKERVTEINPDICATKDFLSEANTYAGTVILASLELATGVNITHFAAGDSTAKVVDRQPSPTPDEEEPVEITEPIVMEGPREHIEVIYELYVQQAALRCKMLLFTAKTEKEVERAVKATIARCFDTVGILDSVDIKIIDVKRPKQGKLK